MPVVGLAEVLLQPVFTGSQRAIEREIGPAAQRAGRTAGQSMGQGMADGLRSETSGMEAEVDRLGKAVGSAQERVTTAKERTAKAAEAEAGALGKLRVAELKLSEIRESGNAKASALAAAEERVATARSKATAATEAHQRSQSSLSKVSDDLQRVQRESTTATENHNRALRQNTAETDRATASNSRFGAMLKRAFPPRPMAQMVRGIGADTNSVNRSMDSMITNVQAQGTRGGRAFTQAFMGVGAGLAALIPATGAAGSALIAASGAVVTLAGSLKQLAGVSALAPAGLFAIAAGAGVLKAAFSGMGKALQTATEATDKIANAQGNPRLAAMAIEDAQRSIAAATRSAADARVNSARRVEDAQRSLRDAEQAAADSALDSARAQEDAARRVVDAQRSLKDTVDDVKRSQIDAARAVEMAQRQEAKAARDVIAAQQDLADAKAKAQARVDEVGRDAFDADRKAVDAAIAYREAIAKYNEAKAKGKGGDELASLDNAVAKAYAADVDAKQAVKDLTAEHQKAKEEAKTASQEVLDAEQRLTDARQAEADAIQDRKDAQADAVRAQEEGAQRIADAEQAITDAVADQDRARSDAARAAEDSSRAVQDAQRGITDAVEEGKRAQLDATQAVADAQRNLEKVRLQQSEGAAKAGQESAQAMGKLTPAAQAAAGALLAVYDRLKGIRNIAQENFFTGFVGPLYALADTIMPQLETGVGRIATAFGLMAQQLMTSLSSALGNGVLDSLLTSMSNIITNLTPAVDPLVQAFVTLAAIGMPYIEQLATWLSNAAIEFNNFVQGAAADGSLKRWIDDGIAAMQDLFSIVGSVKGIFEALADAARAGGIDVTLDSLAGALGRVRTAMESPVFQTTMSTIFAGAKAGAEGLTAAFGPLGDAFTRGADNFARFLELGGKIAGITLGAFFTALSDPTFGKGLTTFLGGVERGVTTLAPLLPGLTAAVGGVLSALAPIAERLGPTLVTVFTNFANGVAKVIEFLTPLLTQIAGSPTILGFLIASFVATTAAVAALTVAANLVRIGMVAVKTVTTLTSIAQGVLAAVFRTGTAAIAANRVAMVAYTVATNIGKAAMWAATAAQKLFNLALRANPIGLVITAIGLLVGALVWFFTKTEVGRKIFTTAWNAIKAVALTVVTWFLNVALPGMRRFVTEVGAKFMELWNKYVKPVTAWIAEKWAATIKYFTKDVPLAFRTFVSKVATEWDKLKEKAKVPIRFVVDKVINKGLIDTFNLIPGVNIKPVKLPPGFKNGGYTGDGPADEVAGPAHRGEFYFTKRQTAAIGREKLYELARAATSGKGSHPEQCAHATRGAAASVRPTPTNSGFFMGNVSQIARHGAYYLDNVGGAMAPWNFGGAAKLWDGAAGVRVRTGRGSHQGHLSELERGGGILGYTTGTNIDMSPSWKATLGPKARLTTSAHEVGHALGLPHDTGGASIMNPNLGNMAATPTTRDIRNLQYLYPGGSGKAGSGGGDNPFAASVVDTLMGLIKKQFPKQDMFVDVAGGILKDGINRITRFIEDVKNGISKIAGNVVSKIKGFFGKDGAQAPTMPKEYLLRDTGGRLPPGFSQVLNGTGQDEFVVNNRQMRNIGEMAKYSGQTAAGDTWNVELPPRASVDDLMNAVSFQQRRNRRGGRVGV